MDIKNPKEFRMPINVVFREKTLSERLEKMKTSLQVKAKEYCRDGDFFHNFNTTSGAFNQTRERVAFDYMKKHWISFLDMLDDIDKGKIPADDYVDEKIGDLINYLYLIEESIKHRNHVDSIEGAKAGGLGITKP